MNLIEAKVTAMIALGLGSFFMGVLPILFTRFSRNRYPLFLSTLLCFGAGVLLSTSMVHMLPEVRESLLKYSEYAELIFCAGFFILYCIDEVVHLCRKGLHTEESAHNEESAQNEDKALLQNSRRHSVSGSGGDYGTIRAESDLQRQPSYNPNYRSSSDSNILMEATPISPSTSNCNHSHDRQGGEPSQLCHIGHQEPCRTSNTSSFSLIVALTVHAILEGLAVGLEDSTSQVLLMLTAIASHKLVVGFCLGMELSSSRQTTPFQYFTSIILFSFGSALGIGVGLSITDFSERIPQLLIPMLQGLAGGTLLYITVSEVLPRERAQWHQTHTKKAAGVLQLVAVFIGFVAMSVLVKVLHD